MKDTIFDYKEEAKKENVVYHFQPTQRLDAIKTVIMDRCKQKQSLELPPPLEHIGGLPSPPVEEKKPVLEEDLSCQDIQAKIDLLKQEKHRLFQRIKQMMLEEQTKKEKLALEKKVQEHQQQLVQQEQEKVLAQEQEKSIQEKKRWDSVEKPAYFYSRPRYNNNLYAPLQHRASRPYSRPPYSR
ncbi:hypothetical protein G6F56_010199 [Rhizopus delemar]|nr:hypothetical protein G6F56_010199 [Rhizopus delemar]